MKKHQAPSTKLQRSSKPQIQRSRFGAWDLVFPWSLDLGVWSLPPGVWSFIPRGLALFLGAFSILNVLGNLRSTGFDANLWWIDLRALPWWLANAVLFVCA